MLHRALRPVLVAAAVITAVLIPSVASAHGFTSAVYADLTATDDTVTVALDLEYDLLVVSAADAAGDDELFYDGTDAFDDGDPTEEADALAAHADTVAAYITERFVISSAAGCTTDVAATPEIIEAQGMPYTRYTLTAACAGDGLTVTSTLFGDDEGYVTGTETILTYDLDGASGSAVLNAASASFTTEQSTAQRLGEFFLLGAEHLLGGIDHILFLLALIVGSRRLREIVLAATAFTVAHSVTFILAATGAVSVPDAFVEPVIALSIAVVALWHVWGSRRGQAGVSHTNEPRRGLDAAGWTRVAVVFLFGLVHGLGFAGALGLDEPWSWQLLWSLLVFNVGIEVVQLVIIAVLFPLLMLLRRRAPRTAFWLTIAVSAGVAIMGLIWFVERLVGA